MNCKEVSGFVSEYVDGCLAGSVQRDFEHHLETCAHCAGEVDATRRLLASLGSLSGQRSPVDCWDHVRASIKSRPADRLRWWRWALRPVVAAPAAAVVAALVALLVWPFGNAPTASDKAFAPEYSYYIGAHSHLQRQQAFADPDVAFVRAELQKASLVASSEQ